MNWIAWLTIAVLAIALVANRIDWKALAVKWVGYNPERGQLYIKAGSHLRTVEAQRFFEAKEGELYFYKANSKLYHIVALPTDYPHEEIRGRRVIGVEDGQIVAHPLGYMDEAQRAKYNEGLTELSALTLGHAVSKALDSVKPQKVFQWMTIVLVVLGIAAAIYWFNFRPQEIAAPGAEQPNQTQQAPPEQPRIIPIKPGQVVP